MWNDRGCCDVTGFLEDRDKATGLAKLAGPWVRAVDPLVGERVRALLQLRRPAQRRMFD